MRGMSPAAMGYITKQNITNQRRDGEAMTNTSRSAWSGRTAQTDNRNSKLVTTTNTKFVYSIFCLDLCQAIDVIALMVVMNSV